MRAIVKRLAAPGVEYAATYDEPDADADRVVVKVATTSICGADRHLFLWDRMGQNLRPTLPLVMGHETAGTIAKVGSQVKGWEVGDRVALESHLMCGECYMCRTGDAHLCERMRVLGITFDGAFAEYVSVPPTICFRLPDGISFDAAALFEPAGVAMHAIQRAGALAGSTVLVTGCGPIGLYLIQLAILAGAARVVAVETNPYRRAMAKEVGAIDIDPGTVDVPAFCRSVAPRRGGMDVAFEASGSGSVLGPVFESVRRDGLVVTVGHPGAVPVEITAHINMKYVTLKGVYGRRIWDTWEALLAFVEAGRIDLSHIVTHRLPLTEFDHSIELLGGDAGKILLYPS
jgi:threonine 3-dehydrogenase